MEKATETVTAPKKSCLTGLSKKVQFLWSQKKKQRHGIKKNKELKRKDREDRVQGKRKKKKWQKKEIKE